MCTHTKCMHVRSPEAVHGLKIKSSQTSCSLLSQTDLTWPCCVLHPGERVSMSPLNRSEEHRLSFVNQGFQELQDLMGKGNGLTS